MCLEIRTPKYAFLKTPGQDQSQQNTFFVQKYANGGVFKYVFYEKIQHHDVLQYVFCKKIQDKRIWIRFSCKNTALQRITIRILIRFSRKNTQHTYFCALLVIKIRFNSLLKYTKRIFLQWDCQVRIRPGFGTDCFISTLTNHYRKVN